MKTNTTRSLKWLTGAVIALGLMALVLFTVQSFGFFTGTPQKAVWIEGFKGMQVSIIILRLIGSITCFSLILAFLFNSIKGQKNGELFQRKNIGILFGLAAASFIFNILSRLGPCDCSAEFVPSGITIPALRASISSAVG